MKNSRLYASNEEIMALHGLSGMGAIVGAADGGYHSKTDAIETVGGSNLTLDGQPIDEIWNEMQTRIAVFNQHSLAMIGLFSYTVDRAQDRVGVYANADFEEATEFGRPNKIRLQYVKRAFPLDHYDLGYGFTQEFLDDARSDDIRNLAGTAENAWNNTRMDLVLGALFNNTNGTDEDGLVSKRLYNNDGEIPPAYRRWTHVGTHTHYLASGAATLTKENFGTLQGHLTHHGYGENGETLIVLVNEAEMATVRAFTNFVPSTSSSVPVVVNGQIVAQPSTSLPGGLRAEGTVGKLKVVEDNGIPAGYVVAFATGGLFAAQNVIGLRVHANASARGLRLVEGPKTRYPLVDAVYDGYAGAAVRHRGAAVVMEATAGAYSVPSL